MLKMRESTKQQRKEPTKLSTQKRRSLRHRILMFPFTRLLIAAIVFVCVALSVAAVAVVITVGIAVLLGNNIPSPYELTPYLLDSSDTLLEAIGIILIYGLFAVAGIITLALMGKVVERRSLAEVGLGRRGLLRTSILGLGIGAGAASLFVLGVTLADFLLDGIDPADSLQLSSLDRQPFGVFGNLALTLAFTCFLAVFEEIVFRGFLFRILEEGLGSWLALAISALLFGMAHLGNFNDPSLLDVTSQTAGGVSLAAAYMLTRKLWLPIGIHWGWDFMIFAVSGGDVVSAMTDTSDSGGALYQVLSGLPDLILGIVLLTLVVQRRQVFTPRWMQRKKKPTHEKPYIYDDAASPTEEKAVDEVVAL